MNQNGGRKWSGAVGNMRIKRESNSIDLGVNDIVEFGSSGMEGQPYDDG